MEIAIWPVTFKIRTKSDASRFLDMVDERGFGKGDGEIYWYDDRNDYCLYVKRKQVGSRPQFARGNIFFPYLIDDNPLEIIWKKRKYINQQLFAE